MEGNVEEENIEIWKLKKLIKSLQNAKGNGTCMISLLIPGKEQLSRVNQTLTNELGAAANIKDRVNRNSVLSAIVSTQQRLKLYNRVPSNGLAIYCGTILTPEGQEKMINIDFEPCRPIKHSLYLCDSVFHTEALLEILESDEKFGFIVVDGNGALFGTLMGNTREVVHRLAVSLPKKHGRGGQSAPRFGRIRLEKRHNYLRKVAEIASQVFLNHDSANVHGIVLAGSAEFKSELVKSDLVDPRLAKLIIKIVDIAYGGMAGFNQAIDLAQDALSNVKFVQEKKVIEAFFDEVAQDSGKYLFGIQECLKTLESGAVETLIVWDSLEISRWKLRNPVTEEETIVYLSPTEEANFSLKDPSSQTLLEIEERGPLVDWLSENYQKYGSCLQLVTGRSSQGAQFVRGFGGVGALLRYQVASSTQEYESDDFYDSEEEQQVFDY